MFKSYTNGGEVQDMGLSPSPTDKSGLTQACKKKEKEGDDLLRKRRYLKKEMDKPNDGRKSCKILLLVMK